MGKDNVLPKKSVATFAGGCFWCLEAIYNGVNGVIQVISGYSGGHISNPIYEQVCLGETGHAEAVQITFNQEIVSYKELLNIFFAIHDPTTPNRQGPDVGTQYRSAVFYHDNDQMVVTKATVKELAESNIWSEKIVTEILPLGQFYCAEDYHQQYFRRNPNNGYCQFVISPKLAKFRKYFASHLA